MRRFSMLLLCAVMLLSACGSNQADPGTTSGTETSEPPQTVTVPEESLPFADKTGYTVTDPLSYPDYVHEAGAASMKLRLTAVRAMRDLLSIRWSTARDIAYYKTGPVSNKFFQHVSDTTYAGVIYSNASAGLFQFMEYYDQSTGRLFFNGTTDELKRTLGSSCADALIWSWTTVCNSVSGSYYPSTMVYANGYIPVGNYTYDYSVKNYNILPTNKILELNGTDVIIEAYTLVQPADALVSTPDNHAMMVIDPPTVIYNEDGSVNTEKSFVTIQDQRGGQGQGFYERTEDGELFLYSGRVEYNYTFDMLLEKSYLPVTTAEFLGQQEYAVPSVTASDCSTLEDVLNASVESNYPLAVVNAILVDSQGGTYTLGRVCFSGADEPGVPRTYALGQMEALTAFADSALNTAPYRLRIEVVTSTGARFIPIEIAL